MSACRCWMVMMAAVVTCPLALGQSEQPLDLRKDVLPYIPASFFPEDLSACSITKRFTVHPYDGSPSEEREGSWRFSPRGAIITKLRWDQPSIEGYNPWYAFRIERPIEEEKWKLTVLYMAGDPGYEQFVQNIKFNANNSLLPPVSVGGVSLREIATFQSFRVTKCVRVTEGGQQRIHVSFEVRPTYEEAGRYGLAGDGLESLRGGTVIIDPQRWVTVETYTRWYSSKTSELHSRCRFDYEFDRSGRIRRYTTRAETSEHRQNGSSELQSLIVTENTIETPGDIPDREFMLTAFGLPEPKGVVVPREGVPIFVWLLAVALVLAILSYLFYRFYRKKRGIEVS